MLSYTDEPVALQLFGLTVTRTYGLEELVILGSCGLSDRDIKAAFGRDARGRGDCVESADRRTSANAFFMSGRNGPCYLKNASNSYWSA